MAEVPVKPSIGSTLPSVKYPILMQVLQKIADGATPRQACLEYGMSLASLKYHLKNDVEMKELFDDALDTGSDALADMLVDIDKVHSNPSMARVISANIQWLLERRKPEKFGARIQVSMNNNATTALISALDKAMDRIPVASVPQVQRAVISDAVFEIVDPLPPKSKGAATEVAAPNTQLREEDALRLLGL